MRRRSRSRVPRASFVVTIALLGCGGQVNETQETIGNPPPADTGSARETGDDVGSSDGHGDACPPTDPVVGTPCALTGGTDCDYSTCDSTGGRGKAYQCIDGTWAEAPVPSCNPPPVCPASEPLPGSTCTASSFGTCSYPDRCGMGPGGTSARDVFECHGTWQLVSPDYTMPCPALPPGDATPCRCGVHTTYASCVWCHVGGAISAICDAAHGLWIEDPDTCVDAGADAGADVDAAGTDGGAAD
jgi:hypothetical protein